MPSELLKLIIELKRRIDNLDDRLLVIEERTCEHENRLEDIESWQEKAEDHLDLLDKEL
jgi:hypothetical protein